LPAEIEVVVAENRRLLREVRELRARVAALETSRWWRLHPRRAFARLLPRRETAGPLADAEPTREPKSSPAPVDPLTARFRVAVIERGTFHSDGFSVNIPTLEPLFAQLEGRQARILEIGSFEGMSACYFAWRLPEALITCVDTFAGGTSFAVRGEDLSELEATFDRNIALVDGARIRKLVGDSAHVLLDLLAAGESFELVYVDGSDLALDVMVDACLSWQLLVPGGFMVLDNYRWRSPLGEDPLLQPASAIDAFVGVIADHCEFVSKEKQVVVRRRA
jgi:predicted O-methyltransferase YrrM